MFCQSMSVRRRECRLSQRMSTVVALQYGRNDGQDSGLEKCLIGCVAIEDCI